MMRSALLAVMFAATAVAQQRTITVSGSGQTQVTPDRAQFMVGVATRGSSVAEAVRENNEKTRRVIEALKARGVAPGEIQTSSFSLQQPYENGRRVVGQYDVQNNVTVTRKQAGAGAGAMSELLQAAVDAGANQAWSVRFFVADISAARDKALAAAYADAKSRAEKLAAAAGRSLGEPVMITTEQLPNPARQLVGGVAGGVEAMSVTPPLEAGTQMVSSTIIVTFELK